MTTERVGRLAFIALLVFIGLNVHGAEGDKCDTCVKAEGCQVRYDVDMHRCEMEKSGSSMIKLVACQKAASDDLNRCNTNAEKRCAREGKC